MRIVLATRNLGKVAELRALLADLPVDLVSAAEIDGAPDVDEDAPTLEGNARKKAWTLHLHTGLPSLADDTGLEVDALGGAPGVHSARFAGPDADAESNRAHLLRELERVASQGVYSRIARFRTVLAFTDSEGVTDYFEGLCHGRIVDAERGEGGFGYDSVFVPDDGPDDRTFAEMSAEVKNAISHRGEALREFAEFLHRHLSNLQ